MEYKTYQGKQELICLVSVEKDERRSYIKIKEIAREATHILIFPTKTKTQMTQDISLWDKPARVLEKSTVIRSRDGKVDVGVAGDYLVVPAVYNEAERVYYCETRAMGDKQIGGVGEVVSVLYTLRKIPHPNTDFFKVNISFSPTRNERDINIIPFEKIYYALSHNPKIKYPISKQLLNKDYAFNIYVPDRAGIILDTTEEQGIVLKEV